MTISRALFLAITALLALSGCAYRNNFPLPRSAALAHSVEADTMRVYVDADGTFYPADWRQACPRRCEPFEKNSSLFIKSAGSDARRLSFRAHILDNQARSLDALARFVGAHPRLFILVHGFNCDEADARASYDRIRDRIAFKPDDGVIEFYWDGLVKVPAKKKLSAAPLSFWRHAVNYSQTAGSRGLRRILALAHGRDIVMISHSRGASVLLSALSNPGYPERFIKRIERLGFTHIDGDRDYLNPPPLPAGAANRIRLLMLAPAIGCVDFIAPDLERRPAKMMNETGCTAVRSLGPDVSFLGYTVNKADNILGKFILPATWYSATDFGYEPKLGDSLMARWSFLRAFPIVAKPHGHAFDCYIADPEFGEMLEQAGVAVNINPKLIPREPCGKDDKPHPKP